MTSAAGVIGCTAPSQVEGSGSNPRAALHSIVIKPIPFIAAKRMLIEHHYLHSFAGDTTLTFGTFVGDRLLGVITYGAGPFSAHCLVKYATPKDCLTLSRLWLSDALPRNSESHVLAILIKTLKKFTNIKFLISYSDPSAGHVGTIYQATGWLYTGLSEPMPLYDIGDNIARHSRSVSHAFGSHSIRYLTSNGVNIKLINQPAKYRYVYFLDSKWRVRLNVPMLPYPKKDDLAQIQSK